MWSLQFIESSFTSVQVTERNSNEEYKDARVHIAVNTIISTSVYSVFSCAVKATLLHQVAALVHSVCVM